MVRRSGCCKLGGSGAVSSLRCFECRYQLRPPCVGRCLRDRCLLSQGLESSLLPVSRMVVWLCCFVVADGCCLRQLRFRIRRALRNRSSRVIQKFLRRETARIRFKNFRLACVVMQVCAHWGGGTLSRTAHSPRSASLRVNADCWHSHRLVSLHSDTSVGGCTRLSVAFTSSSAPVLCCRVSGGSASASRHQGGDGTAKECACDDNSEHVEDGTTATALRQAAQDRSRGAGSPRCLGLCVLLCVVCVCCFFCCVCLD